MNDDKSFPLFSIVMPLLNRVGMVMEALDSIESGEFLDVECIVVDGGSTDGGREIVDAHPMVTLIDAPGSGIYEALNIGIRAARGVFIIHLNSDDWVAPGALSVFRNAITPDADIIRGQARYVAFTQETQAPIREWRTSPDLNLDIVLFGALSINAQAVRRSTYDRIGLYDERFRISSDREWLLRALTRGASIRSVEKTVYTYRHHAESLTINTHSQAEAIWVEEHIRIAAIQLAKMDLPKGFRGPITSFHAREVVRSLVLKAKGLSGSQSSPALLRNAFAVSPFWPFAATLPVLRGLFTRAGRFLGARMRRASQEDEDDRHEPHSSLPKP